MSQFNTHDTILLLERLQKYNEEIKEIYTHLYKQLTNFENNDASEASVSQSKSMTIKEAVNYLRHSQIHLSDFGYYLSGSFERRYHSLSDALLKYPMNRILDKLTALLVIWKQNVKNNIQNASQYVETLYSDLDLVKDIANTKQKYS